MKKQPDEKKAKKRLDLDHELVADLDPSDDDTGTIRGGNSGSGASYRSGLR